MTYKYHECQARYTAKNKKKRRVQRALRHAVSKGIIMKPDECEECCVGGLIHGHHDDYDKPLEVRWLCPKCHKEWHDCYGEGRNG